tara:strand:+ start:3861 stop:4352 length:492 start_codon:yes stop_codon:yes gene_type:complete
MNCKISPNIDNLIKLHSEYKWIPGKNNIRPSDKNLQKKKNLICIVNKFYESILDYIYDSMFSFPINFNSDGKLKASIIVPQINVFKKNDFPYLLPNGTNHYIMWYTSQPKNTEEINTDIYNKLFQKLENNNFEYVWYENPKMTIPEIYHLQVFWREIKNVKID